MLVRSYYDVGEWQLLDLLLQGFTSYLNRQKNLGYHRELNQHFVRFTQRILKLQKGDEMAKKDLSKDIREEKQVAEREWLLEKLIN